MSIKVETQDHVLVVRIDRPEKKNALTNEMYTALSEAIEAAQTNDAIRVVIITGTDNCFSAGNDMKDFVERPPSLSSDAPPGRFMRAIALAPKPLIAAVEGAAIGIGTTLLMHCDLVVAGKSARLQMPFVNLGLVPEAASSYLVPLLLGPRRAARLLLLSEPIDAEKAEEFGIVSHVVENGQALTTALQQAHALAKKPPQAVISTKRLMKSAYQDAVLAQMKTESIEFIDRVHSDEAKATFNAFLNKTK
jgi:enoyl-CoA hydratase/carnithine racemase